MANEVAGQKPSEVFRAQFTRMEGELKAGLPPHIPTERFMRVVLTAVNGNPELLDADRRSLFEAAMKAAQDGLLPDGKEGALVVYNTKVSKRDAKPEVWIRKVQWMPMVAGILKKVRNSGQLKSIAAHVVFTKDAFVYKLGDEEMIEHEPFLDGDAGPPKLVYAIAWTKDGGIYREVMTLKQVEQVRAVSKAKDGPAWKNWWDEMAKKVSLRRLSKRLPSSTDLDDLLRRDDDLYDFKGQRTDQEGFLKVDNPLRDELPPPADGDGQTIEHDENGEIDETGMDRNDDIDDTPAQQQAKAPAEKVVETAKPEAVKGEASTAQAPGPKVAVLDDGEPGGYGDEDEYLIWIRWHIAHQKTATGLKNKMSESRADRRELLSAENLEKVTNEYNAQMVVLMGGSDA